MAVKSFLRPGWARTTILSVNSQNALTNCATETGDVQSLECGGKIPTLCMPHISCISKLRSRDGLETERPWEVKESRKISPTWGSNPRP